LPQDAEEVILKAMSFDDADRYDQPRDFGDALVSALALDPHLKHKNHLHASGLKSLQFILSALSFIVAFGMTTVISMRFLSSGPDALSVAVTASLTLMSLSAGIALTKEGWELLQDALSRFGIRSNSRSRDRLLFTSASFAIAFSCYFLLPGLARVYNTHAIHLQQAGDIPAAVKSYGRSASLNPNDSASQYNLATAYEDVLDFDKAITGYQKALSADPDFYAAYNNLARLYLVRRKEYDSALNVLNMALALKPSEPYVKYSLYNNRGWAHFALGLYD
jgi:tetratricopeptide (TPR) repeat protein